MALSGESVAAVWTGFEGLVVPASYRKYENFDAVCANYQQRAFPVRVRKSGGGVVPQGQGIINLSLVYPVNGVPGDLSDAVYIHLGEILKRTLDTFNVPTTLAAVEGSFCDGRYNLTTTDSSRNRKIAGTAQYWKRGSKGYAVLAHALILVQADTELLSNQASAFEDQLHSGKVYDPGATVSVSELVLPANQADLTKVFIQRLFEVLRNY